MNEADDPIESMRAYQGSAGEPDEASEARREVAEELRALSHALGDSRLPASRMREIAAQLRAKAEELTAAREPAAQPAGAEQGPLPGMGDFRDRSPIAGRGNPLAPPAILRADPDAAVVMGEVTFGKAFEGAPGCVHGGFVAAVLDEALGMASALSGTGCMTAELTTRYRRHTPVSKPLRIEARLTSVEGRKVRTSGEIYDGDTVLVEASGLFIGVGTEKFQELVAARAERAGD